MLRRSASYYKQVRCIRNFTKRKGVVQRASPNPGVENRLQILKMETPHVDSIEGDDVEVDDLESDFSNMEGVHREFEREKIKAAKALSFVITREKFFKLSKLPNLLTWSEKEQIKYLNQLDPKEWDAESLSKSFPSTPEIIKKILKSKWKPKNASDLERHDKGVEKNWILLKEGKINLENDLRRHFLSFSSRKSIKNLSEPKDRKLTIVCNKSWNSEFVDLLSESVRRNDENLEGKSIEVDIPELLTRKISSESKSESFLLSGKTIRHSQHISFKEFKKHIEPELGIVENSSALTKSNENPQKEELNVVESEPYNDNVSERNLRGIIKDKAPEELVKYKKESLEENLTKKQLDVFLKADNYSLKIKVPKGYKDPSGVYKVNDCFYDLDGSFLYRVPGMK